LQTLQRLLPKLSIVNVVATAELGQSVDLVKLADVEGFLYDQAIYHCAYFKDDDTRAKISIFSTGKMISVGSKRFEDAKHDLKHAVKKLEELGLIKPVKIAVKLQNIVATGELGQSMDIESLVRKLPSTIYEPEQFPGAIHYAKELEGASILIFANGKVVFSGLKRPELLDVGKKVLVDLARLISE